MRLFGMWRRGIALLTVGAFTVGLAPARRAAPQQSGSAASTVAQSKLDITHDPLGCINTDFAPKVDAAVAPAPSFERGYVYFKAAGTEDFYYAPMKGAPENLAGVLPRPLPETKAIDYKVRARDVESL